MSFDNADVREYFLDFSVAMTGFSRFHLQGTGQVDAYYTAVQNIVGDKILVELLQTYHRLDEQAKARDDTLLLKKGILSDILGSEKFGPIARNIIKLWYVATWYQLPQSWRENYGATENDVTFIVSPQAYPEGLLWLALGVNPPAAKAPGYGTWAESPVANLST